MRLSRRSKPSDAAPPADNEYDARSLHQAQILREFQEATRALERALSIQEEANAVAEHALQVHDAAKRAMRRVAEGSI